METQATQELYRAPEVLPEGFTSMFVRDELLRCFESANREFLKILNQPVVDDQLRGQVHQFVTQVFRACRVRYANPTKAGIRAAVRLLPCGAKVRSVVPLLLEAVRLGADPIVRAHLVVRPAGAQDVDQR